MSNRLHLLLTCCLWSALFAGASVSSTAAAPLRLVGTDLLAPAIEQLLADRALTPALDIELALTGTRPGADALGRGLADAALLIRAGTLASDRFQTGYRRLALAHLVAFVVAADNNPIESLTVRQLDLIYRPLTEGSIQQWGQAGVAGDWELRTITTMVAAPRSHALAGYFQQTVLAGADYARSVEFLVGPREIAERLTGTRNALVVAPLPPTGGNSRLVPVVNDAIPVPVAADAASIESGRYPLAVPVELVFREGAEAAVAPLARVLFSARAAEACEKAMFLPLSAPSRERVLTGLQRP